MKKTVFVLLIITLSVLSFSTCVAESLEETRDQAKQGNTVAQFNLGAMYHTGQGVALDYAKAVNWYRKSAEQGHSAAQYNLGFMYGTGQGVMLDGEIAYMWFALSAQQGDEKVRMALDIIEKSLPHEQIDNAQKRAAEWKAKKKNSVQN